MQRRDNKEDKKVQKNKKEEILFGRKEIWDVKKGGKKSFFVFILNFIFRGGNRKRKTGQKQEERATEQKQRGCNRNKHKNKQTQEHERTRRSQTEETETDPKQIRRLSIEYFPNRAERVRFALRLGLV
jgi:hypothetical protein